MERVDAARHGSGTTKRAPGARATGIAYLTQIYPKLTETFVYREVIALRRRGLRVRTFAFRRPDATELSQEARPLVAETGYVLPIAWGGFLASHLLFLVTHPLRYLGTLLFVLSRPGERTKNRILTLCHFCGAVGLARTMRREGITHLHAHFGINAATMALVLSRLLGIPFSFTAHNLVFSNPILVEPKLREAAFVACISDFTRRFLLEALAEGDPEGKIRVVHCGVPLAEFPPPRTPPANDVPIMLFVAQLAERKGAPVLVEACRILAERGVAFRCVLVGDGPQRGIVERRIAKEGLEGVVELHGAVPQERLREFLDRADVFVLPCVRARDGDMDGIPVSMMEAMAMEIPTVSTRLSGIPELVEDGATGLLAEPGDPESLANALRRLLEDGELRRRLGRNGRRKVEEEFDLEKSCARLAELFERSRRRPEEP